MQSAPPPIACPACGAPATPETRRCAACRVTLRAGSSAAGERPLVEVFPEVRAGEPVRLFLFPRDPLPGGFRENKHADYTIAPAPNGTMLSFVANLMMPLPDRTVRLRDGCVKATMTPVDPGISVGLSARMEDLEPGGPGRRFAGTSYTARIYPAERRAVLSRNLTFDDRKRVGAAAVKEAGGVDMPPLGTPVTLELLVEGPTIVFRMNERTLLTAHDLTYGIGFFGLLVGRHLPPDGTQRRVVCHDFAMAMVRA